MIKEVTVDMIPYDKLIQTLCRTPYQGHNKGCINYGKKERCPPKKTIEKYFDLSKKLYVIYTEFPVGEFAERMRIKHPEWKEKTYNDKAGQANELLERIMNKLRQKHPEWPESYYTQKSKGEWKSSRQWYNPRRWQPKARKLHEEEIKKYKQDGMIINKCPEALGVNVTGLMTNIGLKMKWQWPPEHDVKNKTYLISLMGSRR